MALIYIVEDDESIREIETIALKNSNYIVSAFENAKEFYKKLDELVPDLILLDVMLPDESGYDIVRKLRKRPATQDIPIIMVTAKTTEMDMIKGLAGGADDYIKKPFSIMELITRVKAVSYTHLDVYKRQQLHRLISQAMSSRSVLSEETAREIPRAADWDCLLQKAL